MTVNIEDLFDNYRLPDGGALVLLMLYFPVGVLLALLRVFIGLHTFLIACLLPKMSAVRSVVLRVLCGVLGILVTQEGLQHKVDKVKVRVANYSSTLDHLALDLVMPSILPCVWDLPPTLMWLLGYTDMGAKQGRETLINSAKKHCTDSQVPILVFPEGASTNGKVGLLKFSVWPFSLDQLIQPILIRLSRPPFARISPSILGGRWWIDVFWFLFVPYTCFHIRLLPVLSKGEEETEEEFTRRVQKTMASELGMSTTSHTSADKVEYTKRKLFIPPHQAEGSESQSPVTTGTTGSEANDGFSQMAAQVKEVLPHVPLGDIKRDLDLTKDVDLTITNILEGRVQYNPEEQAVGASRSASPMSDSTPSVTPQVNMTTVFRKNFKDRQLSLEERKKRLMDNARRIYMEKHGMI